MDCFLDYIGLLGCGTAEPESGLYINSLPQISLESLDKMADAEQQTYLGAWNDIQTRAIQRIKIDIINELAKRFKLRQLSESVDLLKIINKTTDQTTAANAFYGWTAKLNFPTNNYVASAFHCYFFQELKFYSKAAVTDVTFKIFDLQTGEALFTKTQDLSIGWNRIAVNKRFLAYRVFVAVDATAITDLVSQEIPGQSAGCFACACNTYRYGCQAQLKGGFTSSVLTEVYDDDVTESDNVYGLSAVFSVQCNYQSLVCNNRDLFSLAYWYLCGEEAMVEKLNSSRRNFFTMMKTEQAESNRQELNALYKDALASACSGINLDLSDCCIECNDSIQTFESYM